MTKNRLAATLLLCYCWLARFQHSPRCGGRSFDKKLPFLDAINVEDFETNTMTLMLEEACGVDLSFDVYPSTDYNSKINMMIPLAVRNCRT